MSVPAKPIAEIRFVRQKTNVWIDEKFNKPNMPAEIKSITYSQSNRKADIETYNGYKFSLTIDATTGQITMGKNLLQTPLNKGLQQTEIHIYKTPNLF